MTTIAKGATTVEGVIDMVTENLLDGLFRTQRTYARKKDADRNAAQRRAVEIMSEKLKEVWCGDAQTLFKDIMVPDENW